MTHPTTAELIENAADSLRHGVAHYLARDEAPTAIKHAILNIYHSIELLLNSPWHKSPIGRHAVCVGFAATTS